MASAPPSSSSTTTNDKEGASARFNTGYDAHVRDRYASRTVADSGMYLLPYLEKLNHNNDDDSHDGESQGQKRPNFAYLDVGCGPGSITIDFAQRFPEAFFMGVDPGESFISAANARARELGVGNVLFVVGDVFQLEDAVSKGLRNGGEWEKKFGGVEGGASGAGEGIFDVVSCHQVLSHLSPSQRGRALTNMHSVARKGPEDGKAVGGGAGGGGIVAAREADIEGLMSIHPETPLLSQWRTLFYSVLRATHLSNEPRGSDDSGTNTAAASESTPGETGDKRSLEEQYPGRGSTFAGKYLLPTALSTKLWTRSQIAVTGSLNSHSQPHEKHGWVASIAPMLEDEGSAWNKRAVEYLTSSSSSSGDDGGMRGLTRDEALKMMRDIARAWRAWAEDDTAWLGIGSCEIVCRC